MKKFFFALSLILISLSSCKNDDAVSTLDTDVTESTVYTQTMLNGTWESLKKSLGTSEQIIITPTSFEIGYGESIVQTSNYKFDEKKISYSYGGYTNVLTINELTSTKLVVTILATNEKKEYKKIK